MKNAFFAFMMLSFTNVAFGQDGEFHLDKTYDISETGSIQLSCSDAKVFVTGSERNNAHVKIDRKVTAHGWTSQQPAFSVEVTAENGSLKIHEKQKSADITFGTSHEDYRIEIEVPEGVGLTVRGDDGDYFIKNINGSIDLSLDDADAELIDCKGEKFRLRMDDGDLRMNQGKGVLQLDGDDADLAIYKGSFTSIHANLDDGDLVIETSLDGKGVYNLDTQDGLIELTVLGGGGTFQVWHDDGSVTSQGDFKTAFESEDETQLILGNGSAKVNIRADDARIKLSEN